MSALTAARSALGAVVLAAGDSRRMGRPKALLRRGGETFLGHWLRILEEAGIGRVRVVLGREADLIRAQLPLAGELLVRQERPEEGMLSSFLLGLERLPPGLAGCFLCPVDHPLVEARLLSEMAAALRPGSIVLPVHQGRRGHPALFAAELFEELRAAPLSEGARAVVRADPRRVVEVHGGPGVLADIDTPRDLEELEPQD